MSILSVGTHGIDQRLLNNFQRNTEQTGKSIERLSTGKRINSPQDDPAGFIAASHLKQDLVDLKAKLGDIKQERGENHVKQSGLSNVQDVLNDLRGRLDSSSDAFLTPAERNDLAAQLTDAGDSVNRIARQTNNEDIANFSAAALNSAIAAQSLEDKSREVTNRQIELAVDERVNLDVFEQFYQDQTVILSNALSQIEDTDFIVENANFVQSQILTQSAMAAISYSGQQQVEVIQAVLDSIA